uniref:Uncharacterized protein n=1 Tax=Skeletonema marinoi TaxID=267567 RepID=A0A7S2KSK3_9STRA
MDTAQIIFHANDITAEFDNEKKYTTSEYMKMRASFLITFSFPIQDNESTVLYPKQQKSSGRKVLSTALQLIGSIIRCDWDNLDIKMKKLQSSKRDDRTATKRFFPLELTVENLYDQISGASQHFRSDYEPNQKLVNSTNLWNSGILGIPEEIVRISIAPYLKARSLHSLRLTNRRMYKFLQSVVPGLKLKLFHHQIRSLEWMEIRERRCITEEDLLCSNNSSIVGTMLHDGESVCGGDYHRSVTGGATVKLCTRRPNSLSNGVAKSYRFDALSGSSINTTQFTSAHSKHLPSHLRSTKAARGGLLCDEPGLGKTVTVLSLILRSLGLSVDATEDSSTIDDEAIFHSYWESEYLTIHVRRPAILKLVTRLLNSDSESGYFIPPIGTFDCQDYFDVIEKGKEICLQDIRINANKGDCKDFRAFEADIYRVFENAMTYNPSDNDVHRAAQRMVNNAKVILATFKSEQVNTAMKALSRIRLSESYALINMLEAKKRAELHDPLVASSSTLLVVPNPLLNHWEEQIIRHINFQYSAKRSIYYHTKKRNFELSNPAVSFDLEQTLNQGPFVFIDDGTKALPPASTLSRFSIVLTAYNRFTAEWKQGSLENELRATRKGVTYWGDDLSEEASPLLKVHWLRLIVDEGHTMGKNPNNTIQFCSWITAQRRWGMTGTPTNQIASQTGLRNLFFLQNFVKHNFFSRELGKEKLWNSLINNGWKDDHLASFYRLKHLLSFLMVRHTKDDLVELPPPIYLTTSINLSQSEKKTYNTLVSSVRTNIITTSMEGKTSGWQDSLLNPRNSKYANEALINLRISCCGSYQILPSITNIHWSETLEMLRDIHKVNDTSINLVNNFIYRCTNGELSGCQQCGIQLQTLFVIPCGHLVCPECIDSETTSCPVCETPFDADDFQRLQPGIDFQFCPNLEEEKKDRESKRSLSRAFSSPNNNAEVNLEEEEEREVDESHTRSRRHKKGEECEYSREYSDGKCKICREEHFDCNFDNAEQRCYTCFKYAEEVPEYASKAKYVVDKLIELRSSFQGSVSPAAVRFFGKRGDPKSMNRRPLKAIVFSQFRPIYEYFGNRLIRKFGGTCVADYAFGGTRSQELSKFIHDPQCFVMLLSKQGSLGLDLSFVTHLFFLDTIYDKALESQVVARAYRMGASGPVYVEQLTAAASIEEVIQQMNEARQSHNSDQTEKHAKMHFLLKRSQLVRQPQVQMNARRKRNAQDCVDDDDKNSRQPRTVRFKD